MEEGLELHVIHWDLVCNAGCEGGINYGFKLNLVHIFQIKLFY